MLETITNQTPKPNLELSEAYVAEQINRFEVQFPAQEQSLTPAELDLAPEAIDTQLDTDLDEISKTTNPETRVALRRTIQMKAGGNHEHWNKP
jgi:hypothetical protein